MKNKILLAILSAVCVVTAVFGFRELVYSSNVKRVGSEYSSAWELAGKKFPQNGQMQSEFYVAELKAIDLKHVPEELVEAHWEYVNSFEQGIEARKRGEVTSAFDARIAAAQRRMAEIAENY